jgi:hypothetical protein
MYPPETTYPDLRVLPRGLKWGKEFRGAKDRRGDLMGFRRYLDRLRSDHVSTLSTSTSPFNLNYTCFSFHCFD